MGESFLDKKGSNGIKLNDIIEDFKYVYKGQTIKAGDFVNYINGVSGKTNYGTSADTQICSNGNTGTVISAVELENNKVFIAHISASNSQLYGIICTINGVTITYGTDTQLSAYTNTGLSISITKLDANKVFIAHSYSTKNGDLYGTVVTINGTTITAGGHTQLSSSSYASITISTALLETNKVFVVHSYGSSYNLYGMVCTISGTSISKSNETAISTTAQTGRYISTCSLSNNKVFVSHSYNTSYYLYGVICTVSGTTISRGTDTSLVSTSYCGLATSPCLLSNGNVFIAHSYSDSFYLYAIVCSISGTTITKGTDTQLSSEILSGRVISAVLMTDGKIFIAHSNTQSSYYLYGIVVEINNTTITKYPDTALDNVLTYSGEHISALFLSNGAIIVAHTGGGGTSRILYAQIWGVDNNIPTNNVSTTVYEQQVTLATAPSFDAIALSNGVGGTDTAHNEQVKIARAGKLLSSLSVGSLVKDVNSTFLGEPIIWKIAAINHEGYPDNSVTLIADRSIAMRAFDAKEPNNSDTDRQSYGNNRYSLSNIRQWLNSDAKAGQWYSAQHSADQTPSTDYVSCNAYSNDVGFLNGFSENFKNALLDTELTVALNTVTDGGGSEKVTDKIFLASTTEVGLANQNNIAEGVLLSAFSDDASRIAYCTTQAIENSNYANDPTNNTTGFVWWLRTPSSSNSRAACGVGGSGTLNSDRVYYGYPGIRPLCNLSSLTEISFEPDADGCYTLFTGGKA